MAAIPVGSILIARPGQSSLIKSPAGVTLAAPTGVTIPDGAGATQGVVQVDGGFLCIVDASGARFYDSQMSLLASVAGTFLAPGSYIGSSFILCDSGGTYRYDVDGTLLNTYSSIGTGVTGVSFAGGSGNQAYTVKNITGTNWIRRLNFTGSGTTTDLVAISTLSDPTKGQQIAYAGTLVAVTNGTDNQVKRYSGATLVSTYTINTTLANAIIAVVYDASSSSSFWVEYFNGTDYTFSRIAYSGGAVLDTFTVPVADAGPFCVMQAGISDSATYIPAGTIIYGGYGDNGSMKFLSPTGVDLGVPPSNPIPGAGMESMKFTSSGYLAISGGNAPTFPTTGEGTFDNVDLSFAAQATPITNIDGWGVGVDASGNFYSRKKISTNFVFQRWSSLCVAGTSWTIAVPAGFDGGRTHMCVSPDGTILYMWMRKSFGDPDAGKERVHVFSLVGAGSYVGRLHATDYCTSQDGELDCDSSGNIIVCYPSYNWPGSGSNPGALIRYSPAGAILNTYSFPGTLPAVFFMSVGIDDDVWAVAYTSSASNNSGARTCGFDIATGVQIGFFDPEDGEFEFDSQIAVLPFDIGTAPVTIRPLPIPTPPSNDLQPQADCNPQSQVNNGGKGKAGCNTGGNGWVSVYSGPYGAANDNPDPADGEALANQTLVYIWVELVHTDYPSGTISTYRRSFVEMGDLPAYQGGRKTEGLKAIGDVEHGLSSEQGSMEAASVDITYADQVDRLFRDLLDSQDLENDEIRIKMATRAGRTAGADPHILMRASVQQVPTQSPMEASISGVDVLFAEYGPFGPNAKFPFHTFGEISQEFTGMTDDTKATPIPVIYGEKSDAAAVNPTTGAYLSKGLCPLIYLGKETITTYSTTRYLPTSEDAGGLIVDSMGNLGSVAGNWVSDGTVTNDPYHYVARVTANVMSPMAGGRSPTPSPVDTVYGFRTVWNDPTNPAPDYYIIWQVPASLAGWEPFTNPAPPGANIRFKIAVPPATNPYPDWEYIVSWTSPDDGDLWGGADTGTGAHEWDAYGVAGHPCFEIPFLFGSNLGGGDVNATHDRVLLDIDARGGSDLLVPGWTGWPFAETYREYTGNDGVTTFWLTIIYARGPLSDDHKNGVVTMAAEVIGVEDVGDGTGLPFIDAHTVEQHWLENFLLPPVPWTSGAWLAPQWEDGTFKVRSSSFVTRQAFTAEMIGGRGLTVGWYAGTAKSIPEWFTEWNNSTESRLGVNHHGQIFVWGIDEREDPTEWPLIEHSRHVFGPITRTSGEERENITIGSCDWDADFDKFRVGPLSEKSTYGIERYKGHERKGVEVNSTILNVQSQLQWVLQRRLLRLEVGATVLHVPGPIGFLDNYVGTGIQLTTIEGTGSSGFVARKFIVMRRKFTFTTRIVTYTLLDVEDILIATLFPDGLARLFTATDDTGTAPVATNVTDDAPLAIN